MKTRQKNNKEFAIHGGSNVIDWNQYLIELDTYLTELGYRKYTQKLKHEDFAYWKKYDGKYQIGLLIYDWRKYENHDLPIKVTVGFQCMPLDIDCRCDLNVSKDIELGEFEKMAETFYDAMIKYCR